jgi:DASS family divalent anion:Na+ symporter
MVANPLGAEIARSFGVKIGFGSWWLAASVPTLVGRADATAAVLIAPEVDATQAPAAARRALSALGPLSTRRKIVLVTGMVGLGAEPRCSNRFDGDRLSRLWPAAGVGRARRTTLPRGTVLTVYLVHLFTLSSQLNGSFMGFLGQRRWIDVRTVAGGSSSRRRIRAAALRVRQPDSTPARAVFVFLDVGVKLGLPPAPAGVSTAVRNQLFRGNYAAGISIICCSREAGTVATRSVRFGAVTTFISMVLYIVVRAVASGAAV